MDYEKNKTLAILKQMVADGKITQADAEKYCPEIVENEDEMMIKFIKEQLLNIKKTITENYELDAKLTKAIDWLEKQGEQKPAWSEEDEQYLLICKNALAKYQVSDKWDATIISRWLEDKLKSIRHQNNVTDKELAQAKKEAYNEALDKIEYHSGEPTFDDGWSAAIWYLKKRNAQPQPKQEWSKEDEMEVAVLEAYIRSKDWSKRHIDRALGIVDELVNKIKSLRPQNTWKPSDEQMKALKFASEGTDVNLGILKSLHQDLKKLKGK